MPDAIRARIAALRSELDTLDDSLPPEDEMSEADITHIYRRLDGLELAIRDLTSAVTEMGRGLAADRKAAEFYARDLEQAKASTLALTAAVSAIQSRADEAIRTAAEATARQAALDARIAQTDARLREVEDERRERIGQGRALAAVASLGGTAGLGSAVWHLLGWLGVVAG